LAHEAALCHEPGRRVPQFQRHLRTFLRSVACARDTTPANSHGHINPVRSLYRIAEAEHGVRPEPSYLTYLSVPWRSVAGMRRNRRKPPSELSLGTSVAFNSLFEQLAMASEVAEEMALAA